jgi:hypothetical protein
VWKIQELSFESSPLLIIILLKSGKDSIICGEDTGAELPELSSSDHHSTKVRQGTQSAVWKIQELSCQSFPLLIIIHPKSGKDSISCL